ncbi:ABC transporter [Gordonia spumicola]|uniref:ABC transporter n=1 Tax=Gordonia spumicola TaxID=589161 RepID=A0A7I9V303_9ACTN|nr:branched-chain amino acid ABC transporter permease/ATP-binding protein [Gordonia spumicola]GED99784.1 ABC transporter [Gordonia spumicola]
MTSHLANFVLGLGNGAVYAALGLALVMTFKSSGVVNFATGAVALYAAYTYAFLRKGELLVPIPGLEPTVDVGGKWGVVPAFIVAVLLAGLLGVLLYVAVFRPMRNAPVLAKAVAAIGIMLVLQSLLNIQVGENAPSVKPIFPEGTFSIGDAVVPTDRMWLTAVIVGLGVVSGLVLKYTRFGIATEAAAESEKGALVTGLSPDRIAVTNWGLSSMTAAVGGVVISPIVPLSPIAYTMFIVPALAAALVGNFTSVAVTVGAGLAIGMLSSEATYLQVTIDAMPDAGVAEAVPLLLIVVFLLVRGEPMPGRGAVIRSDLGRAPRPDRIVVPAVVGGAIMLVALLLTEGSVRLALVMSMILAVVALSQVVITGYAGQVSLAQLTLAGASAFALNRFSEDLGVPFPIAPILSALVAAAIGVIVGLPALRVRGLPLMVATLALAVFLEAFWFRNPSLNGGMAGAPVRTPTLFGMDLGIGVGEGAPKTGFSVLCLIVLVGVAVGVALLRRSRLGAAMLAVRANERSAAAIGINVGATKLAAFGISSFIVGLGGALIAYQQNNLANPASFSALGGIGLFAVVYIAGVTSLTGGLLAGFLGTGGLVFYLVDRYLSLDDWYMLISGVLLVVTVIVNPDGIAGALGRIRLPGWLTKSTGVPIPAAAPTPRPSGDHTIGEPLLTVTDVGVSYGSVQAVDGVTFEVREGEIVGLIGPNGAGKTTLVDAISGFAPSSGHVELGGVRLTGLVPHRRGRAGLGRTFQDIELYDELSVSENVYVAAPRAGAADAVARTLALLEITELADRPAADLSQGQRQLVSVARVLVASPRVALLDEPAAGLDSTESRWLGERLSAVRADGGSMLLIDHDMDLVLSLCDRIIVLDLGRVIASGTPDEIRTDERVVQAYLGAPAGADQEAR